MLARHGSAILSGMITFQQTVDIPADRHLTLDLPQTVPSGRVSVVLVFDTPAGAEAETAPAGADAVTRILERQFPTIEELKAEAARKTAARLADPSRDSLTRYAGCLADSAVFEGGPAAIQRQMRDEWD